MIDPLKLAMIDRSEPLKIAENPSGGKCVLCDCPLQPYEYIVRIPKFGKAQTHCAVDAGFEVTD